VTAAAAPVASSAAASSGPVPVSAIQPSAAGAGGAGGGSISGIGPVGPAGAITGSTAGGSQAVGAGGAAPLAGVTPAAGTSSGFNAIYPAGGPVGGSTSANTAGASKIFDSGVLPPVKNVSGPLPKVVAGSIPQQTNSTGTGAPVPGGRQSTSTPLSTTNSGSRGFTAGSIKAGPDGINNSGSPAFYGYDIGASNLDRPPGIIAGDVNKQLGIWW